MNTTKEEQEAKEAAKRFWIKYFKESEDVADYNEMTIDCMAKFLSDFQTALIEALNEEVKWEESNANNPECIWALHKAISLVKTVTPKKK